MVGNAVREGVLAVDKPAGMTSHDVVGRLRRALGTRRIGHTGTLDPDATGVLVVCVGRATRLVRFLQAGRKTYAARLVLGRETTTQDASGDVVAERDAGDVDEHALCVALTRFTGEIEQTPPMVSAVKVSGERLHVKARRGEVVERAARRVTVHDLVLEELVPGRLAEASVLVTCSSGTYVRTLAHDLGQVLQVGGSLVSLRRLANGNFTEDDAVALDAVAHDTPLLSPADALAGVMPHVDVGDPERLLALSQGKSLAQQDIDGCYAVRSRDGDLVGVYRDVDGEGRPEAVFLRPTDVDVGRAS